MPNKGSDLIQAFQILNSEGGEEDSRSTMDASRQIKQSHPTGRYTEDNSSQPRTDQELLVCLDT